MPKVSVIIPTYQHAHFVAEAIESVLAQTYPDYEIIVVDDGSTDDTVEVLSRFGERITVIHQPNRGVSAARNTGIRASKGEHIAFLDADDVWMPDKLEKQIPLLERDEAVGLVGSDMMIFDEHGTRSGIFERTPPQSGMVYATLFASIGRSFILMPTVVVRRRCFDEVGFFDETLTISEDADMWLRISQRWAVDFVSEPLAKYRMSANQAHKNTERMLIDSIRVQEKAFAVSPELRALDLNTLDRCFYSLYLQLSRLYLQKGRRPEARSVLRRYVQVRGRTFRYWRRYFASWMPQWLREACVGIYQLLRRLRA